MSLVLKRLMGKPEALVSTPELAGCEAISEDKTVKVVIGEPIKRSIWRIQRSFPHPTNEMPKEKPGFLWSIRFHHGSIADNDNAQTVLTFARVETGYHVIRVKGVILAQVNAEVLATPFVILVAQEETKRVLVTPETYFGDVNRLDLKQWAPLVEGAVD